MKLPPGIHVEQDLGQDDETRGLISLAKVIVIPRLQAARWELRFEGADGLGCWDFCWDLPRKGLRLIHSIAREEDGFPWAHVSVSRRSQVMPTWEQTRDVWRLIYPDVTGVVVIPPATQHVNLAEVSHVWGNLSQPAVPDFTHGLGSI